MAATLAIACVSFLITLALSALYAYNIPSSEAILMIPRPIVRGTKKVITAVQNLPYLPYIFTSSKLPVYEIDIESDKLDEIHKALPKENMAMLPDEAKILKNAVLRVGDKTYNVRFGIHGDTNLHWLYEQKSWRVKIEGEDLPGGMREMMFIIPIKRFFVVEQLNNYRAKKLGLLMPESKFVNLKINGRNVGVYFLSEGWSEDFLTSAGVAMPTNLYGERAIADPIFDGVEFWKKYTKNSEQKFDDYGELRRLLDFIRNADDDRFRKKIFTLIDEDNFYDWYVHALLSGSTHQDWAHNLRIYFDRGSGKLKFIPWDVGAGPIEGYGVDINYNPLISRIISVPEFKLKRDELLYKYVSDPYNLSDDLAAYDKITGAIKVAVYKDSLKNYSNKYYDNEVAGYREILKRNFASLKKYLERSELTSEIFVDPAPGMAAVLDLVMTNPVPLKLERIDVVGKTVIEDTNRNGRLDQFDRVVPKDKLLYSRITPSNPKAEAYAPFVFVPEKYRFFVLPGGTPATGFKINVSASNIITGQTAAIKERFFSSIPLKEIYY